MKALIFILIIFVSRCCLFAQNSDTTQIGTFPDTRDGHIYKWIKIGDQVWMAENLAFLPEVSSPKSGSFNQPFYYVYGYIGTNADLAKTTANFTTYGVLYNWPAAMNGNYAGNTEISVIKGVCPVGWHLPNDAEWTIMSTFLGGDSLAGCKMKENGITHWKSRNACATNSCGFSGLPGGIRSNGYFNSLGFYGSWWSSSKSKTSVYASYVRFLHRSFGHLIKGNQTLDHGYSVRCIRDENTP